MCINDTHSSAERTGGFTLIELLIVIAIITIVSGFVFSQHTGLASRSNLNLRTSQIAEHIQFAQSRSSSSEVLGTASEPTRGFQIVRLLVRNGLLDELRFEKIAGDFSMFTPEMRGGFGIGLLNTTIPISDRLFFSGHENYYLFACFIDTDGDNRYYFEPLDIVERNDNRCIDNEDIFCRSLDPVDHAAILKRNNFDVHLSLQQPTREIHANILPVLPRNISQYSDNHVRPNGYAQRESKQYEGVRLVLITSTGIKRSIDVYHTGLVSTKADDSVEGCSQAVLP